MMYDRNKDYYLDSFNSSVSCAFEEVHINGQPEQTTIYNRREDGTIDWWGPRPVRYERESQESHEDRLWKALCGILMAAEKRPVLVPTTDKEPVWRDLVAACPHAKLVGEAQSHHGKYNAQLWVFDLKGTK